MLLQKLHRLKHPIALLSSGKYQLRSSPFEFIFHRLKLGHAFYAVRSPRAAQEFDDHWPTLPQIRKRKVSLAVCRRKRKIRRTRPNSQCLREILHLEIDFKSLARAEQERMQQANHQRHGRESCGADALAREPFRPRALVPQFRSSAASALRSLSQPKLVIY